MHPTDSVNESVTHDSASHLAAAREEIHMAMMKPKSSDHDSNDKQHDSKKSGATNSHRRSGSDRGSGGGSTGSSGGGPLPADWGQGSPFDAPNGFDCC